MHFKKCYMEAQRRWHDRKKDRRNAPEVDTLAEHLYNQHKAYIFLTAFGRILREISLMESMLYPKPIYFMMSIAYGDRKRGGKAPVSRTLVEQEENE